MMFERLRNFLNQFDKNDYDLVSDSIGLIANINKYSDPNTLGKQIFKLKYNIKLFLF